METRKSLNTEKHTCMSGVQKGTLSKCSINRSYKYLKLTNRFRQRFQRSLQRLHCVRRVIQKVQIQGEIPGNFIGNLEIRKHHVLKR